MVDNRVSEDNSSHALVGGVVIVSDGAVAGAGVIVVNFNVAGG